MDGFIITYSHSQKIITGHFWDAVYSCTFWAVWDWNSNGWRSGLLYIVDFFFFSCACHDPQLVSHETSSSSAECSRDKPPFSFVRGQDSTVWDIVWISPQGHRSVSVSRHFLLQVPQCLSSVETTVVEGGQNPVSGLWGRTLSESWPPELTSSSASSLHLQWPRGNSRPIQRCNFEWPWVA